MKESKKQKGGQIFGIILFLSLTVYTVVFVMVNLGYYEYSTYKKKTFTEEQILAFEEDVKKGIPIDLNKYIYDEEDFQDKPKRVALKLSEGIGAITTKSIKTVFKFLDKLIEE